MKIVFSDMDGTLLTTEKRITPLTWEALDRLAGEGIPFVPCTGRSVSGIPGELLRHPATRFAIGANGATTFSVGSSGALEKYHTVLMDKVRALEIYELVRDASAYMDVFADGRIYVERERYDRLGSFGLDEASLGYMRRARTSVDILTPQIIDEAGDLERVTVFWSSEKDRDAVRDYLDHHPDLVAVSSYPKNFEITNADATKGSALRWLCGRLGIDPGDAVAFGDTLNDVSMLLVAGDGVSMANGTPEAIAAADHVAPSNDEDGVASYLGGLLN